MKNNVDEKIGVIHGRFQCLHKGHLEYLLAGAKRCDRLIVGITNFDVQEEKPYNEANPKRANKESNPLSYYHRYMMVKNSLIEAGLDQSKFDVVPFPIEFPEKIFNYVPKDATFFVTIYDKWGEKKLKILEDLGVQVDVMWRRTDADRLTSGTEVRKLIKEGGAWEHLVPPAVAKYLVENNLLDVVKGDNK